MFCMGNVLYLPALGPVLCSANLLDVRVVYLKLYKVILALLRVYTE